MGDWSLFFRHVLEFGVLLPAAVAVLLPMTDNLKIRFSRTVLLTVSLALCCMGLGAFACVRFEWNTNRVLFPLTLLMLFVCRAVCTLEWPKLLFAFFNAAMLSAWGTLEASYLFAEAEAVNPELSLLPKTGAASLVLSALTVLLFSRILRKKMPQLFDVPVLEKLWNWFYLIPLATAAFFWWLLPRDFGNVLVGRVQYICLMIWLLMLGIVLAFYQFLWYLAGHLGREQQLIQENTLLHAEEERYQQLQEHVQETRRLRHDFRQHLRVLSELANAGDLSQIKTYLADYGGSISGEHRPFCENPAADAIAAWYQRAADAQKTSLEWKLALPKVLPIQDNNYCMILGNLVENALAGSMKLSENERLIRVSSQMIGDQMMGLSVANRYAGEIFFNKKGLPIQRGREGIGLQSVSSAVEKAGGTMAIDAAHGWFTVNILFHL